MKQNLKSWPFKEAASLKKRFKEQPTKPIIFETGFGPSGLPHIGTFAEVARTTWVRKAFEYISGWPTTLIAFSDDMDGLRKVPINLPNQDTLNEYIGKPISAIPDPFGCCDSFSGHMNKKLCEFLDQYGFDYEFQSSKVAYERGDFNNGLSILLERVENIKSLILPTMSEEKRKGWSPFFPICGKCGRINSTAVTGYHPKDNTIDYICSKEDSPNCGHKDTTSVLDGNVKVGWKVDWALRWFSYGVAYEMYGKDLIESARLSAKITRHMGGLPPAGMFYEMFLDEKGQKISKSVGKGLTVNSWMSYAPLESLLHYLFQSPSRAKKLYWDVVPKAADEFLGALTDYQNIASELQPDSPMWHIYPCHKAPSFTTSINYSVISNLISGLGDTDESLILEFLERYDGKTKENSSQLKDLISKAGTYYTDNILPNKSFRDPTEIEKKALAALREKLRASEKNDEKSLQAIPFDVARELSISPKDIFMAFYEVILGQERGPRFGTLTCLIGKERMLNLLSH